MLYSVIANYKPTGRSDILLAVDDRETAEKEMSDFLKYRTDAQYWDVYINESYDCVDALYQEHIERLNDRIDDYASALHRAGCDDALPSQW